MATNVVVVSATKITCTFDLSEKTPGQWDVVVTNPDGQSASLAGAFTITTPVKHDLALTYFSARPTSVYRLGSVTFSYTVRNVGDVRESNVTFRLLSGGVMVGQPQSLGTIRRGASKSGSVKVRVPLRQRPGEYLITGEVVPVYGETNTANNRQTVKVTVR